MSTARIQTLEVTMEELDSILEHSRREALSEEELPQALDRRLLVLDLTGEKHQCLDRGLELSVLLFAQCRFCLLEDLLDLFHVDLFDEFWGRRSRRHCHYT